jgi:MFS family permease
MMSSEGVALISRVALVAVLIVVTAVVRTVVGPSKRRGLYMGLGTLGGMAAGIAMASLVSRWIMMDVSVIFSCLGIFAGWSVAWLFARRIPREAN